MTPPINKLEADQVRILQYLHDHGWSSTSKISYYIKRNGYTVNDLLSDLKDKGKIVSEKRPRGEYWNVKK